MTRLDRLMVAAKEIVGEHYHIHGVGLAPIVTRQTSADPDADVPSLEKSKPPREGEEV
jgi:hypothetical protein